MKVVIESSWQRNGEIDIRTTSMTVPNRQEMTVLVHQGMIVPNRQEMTVPVHQGMTVPNCKGMTAIDLQGMNAPVHKGMTVPYPLEMTVTELQETDPRKPQGIGSSTTGMIEIVTAEVGAQM